jgi:hypothetical protein
MDFKLLHRFLGGDRWKCVSKNDQFSEYFHFFVNFRNFFAEVTNNCKFFNHKMPNIGFEFCADISKRNIK